MKRRTLLQQAGLATFGLALPAWAQTLISPPAAP